MGAPAVLVSLWACSDGARFLIDPNQQDTLSGTPAPDPTTEMLAEPPAAANASPGSKPVDGTAEGPSSSSERAVCGDAEPPACVSDDAASAQSEPAGDDSDGAAAEPSGGQGGESGGAGAGEADGSGDPSNGSGDPAVGDGDGPPVGDGDGPPDEGTSPPEPEALPDLIIDGAYLTATIEQDIVDASADLCLFNEGCVTGDGPRRVVRFGTRSANLGTADVVVGAPLADNPLWEFDACHEHFHFEGYARYDLIDAATGAVLPIGNKNGFCLQDLDVWTSSAQCDRYNCDYQGISVGCADVYTPDLDCQWIDITDVAPGNYELVVTVNTDGSIRELNTLNNTASVSLEILKETIRLLP
jgi:hypothetical protein